MKNNYVFQSVDTSEPAKESAIGRFQFCRESRGGNFIPHFSVDSGAEATRTEICLPVLLGVNHFYDWFFAMIACDIRRQRRASIGSECVSNAD